MLSYLFASVFKVLKHDTVEKALMLEIDGEEVELLRKFIPEWSDCSDFSENDRSCYDDPRTELLITDAIKWFIDNFGERRSDANDGARREHFDVMYVNRSSHMNSICHLLSKLIFAHLCCVSESWMLSTQMTI